MRIINRYDEMLDECYGPVKMGTFIFDASSVLRELDPTAYRCGFNDWLDGEDEDTRTAAESDGSFNDL